MDPLWPVGVFHQLRKEHKIILPKLIVEQVEAYFVYRMADDREARQDIKGLKKGQDMFDGERVQACSFSQAGQHTYFSGLVKAHMKKKVL